MDDEDPGERERLRKIAEARETVRRLESESAASAAVFATRTSLARTPPDSFSTPRLTQIPQSQTASKRLLSSPEEQQEQSRRRVQESSKRPAAAPPAPPAAGAGANLASTALEPPTVEAPMSSETSLSTFATIAAASTIGIMEAVKSKQSKLNKDEMASIGAHVASVSSVVTHLIARLAAAEQRAAVAEAKAATITCAAPAVAPGAQPRSYSGAVKLSRNAPPVLIPTCPGPAMAIHPAEDQREVLKTAEDTKKALQTALDPAALGIKVHGLRKTGGAGIIVTTTSEQEAIKFRAAVPPTLKISAPKERRPLISLVGVDGDIDKSAIVGHLRDQNLPDMTEDELKSKINPLFCRNRRNNRKLWVCECAPDLRRALIDRGKVYMGWDVVEVCDFVGVTLCKKCQMLGHPEKYCRASTMTCAKCGDDGHKAAECQSLNNACATCKKLGRPSSDHTTNALECPARKHAEQRAMATTNYHG